MLRTPIYIFSFFTVIALVTFSACKTSKKSTTGSINENMEVVWDDKPEEVRVNTSGRNRSNRQFYSEHSKKLGYELNGNENQKLIAFISDWLGTPYRYGGHSKNGTDCSGFILMLYREVYGIDLARSSYDIARNSQKIKKHQLKEGDLVFFKTSGNRISHVGIYLSNNKFAHASSSRGVTVNDLSENYYMRTFAMAGRIAKKR